MFSLVTSCCFGASDKTVSKVKEELTLWIPEQPQFAFYGPVVEETDCSNSEIMKGFQFLNMTCPIKAGSMRSPVEFLDNHGRIIVIPLHFQQNWTTNNSKSPPGNSTWNSRYFYVCSCRWKPQRSANVTSHHVYVCRGTLLRRVVCWMNTTMSWFASKQEWFSPTSDFTRHNISYLFYIDVHT